MDEAFHNILAERETWFAEELAKREAWFAAELAKREAWYAAELAQRDAIIAKLEQRIAELELLLAKALKNSSNSSKPPSSDIVKPKPPCASGPRKPGGQPGHPRHERSAFTPENVDEIREYVADVCPHCGGALEVSDLAPHVLQQVELADRPVRVTEHRAPTCVCRHCGKTCHAPLPREIQAAGLIGPKLTARAAFLKAACHASYSSLQHYFREALGIGLSRGQLAKLIGKAARALEQPYAELRSALPSESALHVDETGHKERGGLFWTWCFRARDYALFHIAPSRGTSVLLDLLGENFAGVLGCDFFSAYRKYARLFSVRIQYCLAHLIRDLKFLTTLPHPETIAYGERLLDWMRILFGAFHQRETLGETAFGNILRNMRTLTLETARAAPNTPDAQRIAKRFEQFGGAYFQFIETPEIAPTNNEAEQTIRFVVLDRHVTQGTRSEQGRQWSEPIWTTMATCAIQGNSAYRFIEQAIAAYFSQKTAPSLLFKNP
jgi:transposase